MNKGIYVSHGIKVMALIGLYACLLFFLVGYTDQHYEIDNDQIFQGIFIENVDVGGLTKEEAITEVTAFIETKKNQLVRIEYGTKVEEIPLLAFDFDADVIGAVEEAYLIGKVGNVVQRYKIIKDLEQNPKHVDIAYSYNEEKIRSFLESIKNNFSTEPKNAIIQRINQGFVIEKEVAGSQLNVEETLAILLEEIDKYPGDILIQAKIEEVVPTYTSEYFEVIKDTLGHYQTSFNGNNTLRTENLKVGASKINGTVLHPNEVMSTHDALSPITAANGYKEAPIIVNGEIEDGMGGGICQIATTLYNAVLLAELEVLERRNHSIPVSYIEKGKDAVLFGDILDLKFKNNTDYPIYIESYVEGDQLFMTIYGLEERDPNRRIEFESVVLGTVSPPPAKLVYDNTLLKGQRKVQQKEIPGYKVKLYKNIYVNDVFVEKELVNYSEYRATPAIIKVGTKEEAVETMNQNNVPLESEESAEQSTEALVGETEEELEVSLEMSVHLPIEENTNKGESDEQYPSNEEE